MVAGCNFAVVDCNFVVAVGCNLAVVGCNYCLMVDSSVEVDMIGFEDPRSLIGSHRIHSY